VPNLQLVLRKPLMSWLVDTILWSIRPTRGFIRGDLISDVAAAPAVRKTSKK
jgi:hypothetical protein